MNQSHDIAKVASAVGPRVLIVSFWFPPYGAVASVRMGKLAEHLLARGWDVRVLTAGDTNPASMKVDFPSDRVTYTKWSNVNRLVEETLAPLSFLMGRSSQPAPGAESEAQPVEARPRKVSPLRAFLRRAFDELVCAPDNRIGWKRAGVVGGHELIREWRPDVIYATSPPMTSLIVADALARRHGIPWVAEFRDLWTDNPRYDYSALRKWFERRWETDVLKRTAAIVTVSPRWERLLAGRFGRPTRVAMNGCVVADFPAAPPVEPERTGPLRIVYTGHIYENYRDPSPLFSAIAKLKLSPSDVVVEFVGTEMQSVRPLAARFGVLTHVIVQDYVPFRKALEIQLHADILLHLQWCHPKEDGTIASKIFDYLCARRPILGIALEDSIAGEIVMSRGGGLVTNDVDKIARQLELWLAAKRSGGIPPLPAKASDGLERSIQFETIKDLIASIAGSRAHQPAG